MEDGYDPINPKYADQYAGKEWSGAFDNTVDAIEKRLGSLSGLRILDLGAGPGQYSVAFALCGARVTWQDPSRAYLQIAQEHAKQKGVSCEWSLGFMEAASRFEQNPFDLVFCRICWYYCVSDTYFADMIVRLIKPVGAAWVDISTASWAIANQTQTPGLMRKLFRSIYRGTGIKFAYYMPGDEKISRIFSAYKSITRLEIDRERV